MLPTEPQLVVFLTLVTVLCCCFSEDQNSVRIWIVPSVAQFCGCCGSKFRENLDCPSVAHWRRNRDKC